EAGALGRVHVEHFQRQLAAGDCDRPAARHPALVEIVAPDGEIIGWRILRRLVRSMQPGIEDPNDLVVYLDGMRHEGDVGEQPTNPFSDRALAVAGRTIEQDRAASGNGRPDSL